MAADIQTVAKTAGVSISTVSRTFTKPELVAPRTREKVTRTAERLGFHISRSAAALKSGQTMRIALLTSDGVSTWFDAHAFAGLDSVFHPAGYDVSVYTMTTTDERRDFFMNLPVRRNVDAVIVDSFDIDPEEVKRLKTMHVPIVGINVPSSAGFDATVGIDDKGAMHTAVDHLAALGHRDIGYIGQANHRQLRYSAESRLQGFADACREHSDVRPQILLFDSDSHFVDNAINGILTAKPRLTAVCIIKDELALPIVYRLHQYGREVPRDLSVVGFDDIELAGQIGLTTLHQNPYRLGVEAARKTLLAMGNKSGEGLADADSAAADNSGGTEPEPTTYDLKDSASTNTDESGRNGISRIKTDSGATDDDNHYTVFDVPLMLRNTTAPPTVSDGRATAQSTTDENSAPSAYSPLRPTVKTSSYAYVPTPAYRGKA
ncbi:LacI family DNA-binding transcriptional regulator [Bifidobacterium sp. ESL0745]|uniref:LacI family DNA-binding transcriptional regulator n=1 Tax=Bifidobacterium sp. ESL0745 TaxID=2983226 RepID=UPI0023F6E5EA|nr:LacI family DNA-binding transcriptional regulator [Bifidobacterium sp. ESL0745]MDF7665875.1 LacI family DNA-binding transcriptional regulator [Bifidobacterium sp. ESL0745]